MVKEKMENKYLNEAIIGNKNMIATFTSKGELQRLYFPSKDNKQYINFFHTGVKINNSDLIYLQNDINNVYKQYYDTDTNVLNTEITNTYFNLKIVQTDFIMIKENVLVKKYIFLNDGKIDLDTKFYIHSELLSDQNNQVGCKIVDGGMMQYAHDFSVSTFAKEHKLCSHQINGSKETIKRGEIQDKDYIGMSKDSSISYDLGIIKPQEKKILEICILIDENRNLSDMEDEIDRVTKIDLDKEYTSTKSYWRKYVKAHNSLGLKEAKNSYEERILEIYKRSILLFPLLANQETGGIIASPEIDENFTKCGRYAYCWPRDAVFITKAMDILNMEKETEIHSVGADFMQVCGPEVFMPSEVIISVSNDGKEFTELKRMEHKVVKDDKVTFTNFGWEGNAKARYIRYQASSGEFGGFLFTDEIVVK